jgi:hypothetical protein
LCSTYCTGPRKPATVTTDPSAARTREITTCGTGVGVGVGVGVGAAWADGLRIGADGAAWLVASGGEAAGDSELHAAVPQAASPTASAAASRERFVRGSLRRPDLLVTWTRMPCADDAVLTTGLLTRNRVSDRYRPRTRRRT